MMQAFRRVNLPDHKKNRLHARFDNSPGVPQPAQELDKQLALAEEVGEQYREPDLYGRSTTCISKSASSTLFLMRLPQLSPCENQGCHLHMAVEPLEDG